jgi:hypothetical protein
VTFSLDSWSTREDFESVPWVLIDFPCGKNKIWDREPEHGPVAAAGAYIGTPFRLNCQYAERLGDAWFALNAKYGFIAPDFSTPEPYGCPFKCRGLQGLPKRPSPPPWPPHRQT